MASHIVGYPRMGPKRELKFALESFWDGKSSAEDLKKVSADLRSSIWKQMSDAGIKYIPSNTFSYYDQVLDTTAMLGAVPSRYNWTGGEIEFDTYFSMARGNASVPAMEMTKWFDTNYHFIVPELGPDVKFSYASHKAVNEYKEAKALGVDTVPVLVGPVSYLLLSKPAKGVEKSFPLLSLLDKILPVYKEVIGELKAAGASWIQFDEPTLVLDLEAHKLEAFTKAYADLESSLSGLNVLVETYFADVPAEAFKTLTALKGVTAFGFDLVRGAQTLDLIKGSFPSGKYLFAGVVDGRNIWANDLAASLGLLQSLEGVVGKDKLVVSTSCSLLHTAVDLINETKLDDEIKSWLAFAAQKVVEVNALAKALSGAKDEAFFSANAAAQASRKSSPRVTNEAVQKASAALQGSDHRRATNVSARLDAQQKKLNLPILPTTTIGSFPQTVELRRVRREYKAKKISEEEYVKGIKPLNRFQDSIYFHSNSSQGLAWAFPALLPPLPRICGSPDGPAVTGPRIKLRDGRHLAYMEYGVPKETAKYKVVYAHSFGSTRYESAIAPLETLEELGAYVVSFDRPGYGESDPHPKRTIQTTALDMEELADQLGLGPKFYVMGYSMGGHSVWGCLKHIPNRLAGAALVAPVVNYWWPSFPANLSTEGYNLQLPQDQWALRVAHHAPWLVYWWNTQKWFPCNSVIAGTPKMSPPDLEVASRLAKHASERQKLKEYAVKQGVFESLHRDMMVGFGKWDFDPMDLQNVFPNGEGSVHLWHGDEDWVVPVILQCYVAERLPWIHYHEMPNVGHLVMHDPPMKELIWKTFLTGGEKQILHS